MKILAIHSGILENHNKQSQVDKWRIERPMLSDPDRTSKKRPYEKDIHRNRQLRYTEIMKLKTSTDPMDEAYKMLDGQPSATGVKTTILPSLSS